MDISFKSKKKTVIKDDYQLIDNDEDFNKLKSGTILIGQIKIDLNGNIILIGYSNYNVTVATSCLINPIDGDRVSVIVDNNNLFITNILARNKEEEFVIDTKGVDLAIVSPNLKFITKDTLKIQSNSLELNANYSLWQSNIAKYRYNKLYVVSFDSYYDIKHSSYLNATNYIIDIKESYSIRSKIGVMKSNAMLKLDGSQIHMG